MVLKFNKDAGKRNKTKWNFEPLINGSHSERGLMGGVMLIVRK